MARHIVATRTFHYLFIAFYTLENSSYFSSIKNKTENKFYTENEQITVHDFNESLTYIISALCCL